MKLINYLPPFMGKVEEFIKITEAEQPEFDVLCKNVDTLQKEFFAETAGEYGLSRLEKAFGISDGSGEDIDLRRFRIKTRLGGCKGLSLYERLENTVGKDNFTVDFNRVALTLDVRITVKSGQYLDVVKNMLERLIPCNIALDVRILYTSYNMLNAYTHEYLSGFKNEDIKLIGI